MSWQYPVTRLAVTSAAVSGAATYNTGMIDVSDAHNFVNILMATSGVSGTVNMVWSVQWSFDGVNFFNKDGGADTLTAVTAAGSTIKQVTPFGPYMRLQGVLTGTAPALTYTVSVQSV